MELMQKLGFSSRWRDWVAQMLSTASSSVLLNGDPGDQIWHHRGLRQGDSLSPLLFILAIDPLHRLLAAASEHGILAPLPGHGTSMRVSLYANDVVIFANPSRQEVDTLMELLNQFGDATWLKLNQGKSSVAAIRCDELQLSEVLQGFGGSIVSFPVTYLGLPIMPTRLRMVHFQFLIDRAKARLAGWKGKLMNLAGRRVLVRSVLSALPTFAMTVLKVPKKILKEIDKSRRRFLWAQEDELTGGKCKVAWEKVCAPVAQGGLGILDLHKFSRSD